MRNNLLVIVGATATGKTQLGHELGLLFNGEIVSGDSRTLYKGMDIGTAKPSSKEMEEVPYHMIDIAYPNEVITVADYKRFADKSIQSIQQNNKLPILVGGTGLYIDAVVYDYKFRKESNLAMRTELEKLSVEQLHRMIIKQSLAFPSNKLNKRHLIRTLETKGEVPKKQSPKFNTLIIGISYNRDEISKRIIARTDKMLNTGLENEVRNLITRYGWTSQILNTIGYKEFKPYFEDECTLDHVKAEINKNTLAYAKRQNTWFKRNKSIQWIGQKSKYVDIITTFLNK